MHLEFKSTDEIVCVQILRLIVIRIVNFNLEDLLLLKVEINHDLSDELGVEVVVDDFRLADLLPHVSRLLEQDTERV